MYQTVGQDAIELVAHALDVPLYRQVIRGSAVEQGSEYGTRAHIAPVEGDETEDLYTLLSRVKSHHPDVKGVSVGAILSNYQRVRVEHVLGLTPLCYLWQRDQESLLSEMIAAGMEAVIIKVAGIGLTIGHLGRTLGEMQQTLRKLNHLYGSHICGEGGEYETLTLDFPLFKHKIRLEEVENVIHSDNDFATVAFLRVRKASLVPKNQATYTVIVPPLLDDKFKAIFASFPSYTQTAPKINTMTVDAASLPPSIMSRGAWVSVANVQRSNQSHPISIEEEVADCFTIMKELLSRYRLQLCNCVIVIIYVSSMEVFARVNAVYSTFFGTSPPARACVAVDLPPLINVRLECLAFSERNSSDRQALHVQGLSYWAPANIGPYSQAIMVDERIFISGQIGLVPSSLSLPSPASLALETTLACQHAARISKAFSDNSGGWEGHAQAIIYWFADMESGRLAPSQDAFSCTLFVVVKELPKGALVEKQVMMSTGRFPVADPDDGIVSLQTRYPTFTEGEVILQNGQLHWQKSQLQDTLNASVVICMRGGDLSSISQLLRAAEPFDLISEHCITSRLFHATTLQAVNMAQKIMVDLDWNATTVPCRHISTFESDWDIVLFILTAQ
ncbi:hypothetical protein M378DRAFT_8778 [Amanita muscaria Koide BX008]|uniref:Diphthine--ammonia ligase n=1 Tax=Amanita muscaria (strain Koide BX008) TaxID=946122 RepID=A0A0C2SX96_AMAMK|nr:hypothetical protein M378DRAFT_8778 [Amanita muscaria Koide BX008]